MRVFIEPDQVFSHEIQYSWNLFAFNKQFTYHLVHDKSLADFVISSGADSDLPLAVSFYEEIAKGNFNWKQFFQSDSFIRNIDGRIDYLATAFYIVNCVQEYGASALDEIGRFKYTDTFQHHFQSIDKNIVQQCFDALLIGHPKLNRLHVAGRKTRVFLSHDIDSIHGAFREDRNYLIKQFRLVPALGVVARAMLQRPDWFNMDKIMQIEDAYSFKSTFFWLVRKGMVSARELNADYSIEEPRIQHALRRLAQNGWENGLHKSISGDSFGTELRQLPLPTSINRYHYLKFTVPEMFRVIAESGLKMDASLGFAEKVGFRNGYGLPFKPFDLKGHKTFEFVEVPLHVMDGTFHRYLKQDGNEALTTMIHLLEQHKENAVISILWHNSYFSNYKYKGFFEAYKKLLAYLHDAKIPCMSGAEIIGIYA